MDVEGSPPSPSSSPSGAKRLHLKKALQASFGSPDDPDYVFDIAASGDNSIMAVSLSTNAIKTYSPMTGQPFGDCLGHTDTITDLLFPDPKAPHTFCSSSCDGTIRVWDTRSCCEVSHLRTHQSPEIYSISFGGSGGHLFAAGGKAKVLCWDWRTRKELACMEECHTEDVTQVHFHPMKREKLVSASVDGLICVFDTCGDINDDEGLDHVMGVGTSIGKIGFYGTLKEKLWCLTHIETLSVWDFQEGTMLAEFNDARLKASTNWASSPVDYLVHCHYAPGSDSLWLVAGNNLGSLGYFPLSYSGHQTNTGPNAGMIGPVSAVLEGGHTSIVRTVWSPTWQGDQCTLLPGLLCWTGGEDGRLCSWSEGAPPGPEMGKAWVSKALVMKKSSRHKQRHKPY